MSVFSIFGLLMTTFFISDTHFGHKNIIKYCDRPFCSVDVMDQTMIRRWSTLVNDDDVVYFIGDFSFASQERTREILGQLPGHKHLIMGNHDEPRSKQFWLDAGFETVQDELHLFIPELARTVLLKHHPIYFNHSGVQFHGHVHNKYGMDPVKRYIMTEQIQVNMAVELWGYGPVSIEEIVKLIEAAE